MEISVHEDEKIAKIAEVLCSLLYACKRNFIGLGCVFDAEQFYRLIFYFWGYEVLSVVEEREDGDYCGDFVFMLGGDYGSYESRIGFGSCSGCDWFERLLDDHFRFKKSGDESNKEDAVKDIKYMVASIVTDIKKINGNTLEV